MILHEEFIGLPFEVTNATNASLIGMHGTIIDETQYSFVVETARGRKRLLKHHITITILQGEKKYQIAGKKIIKRPYERVKK